MEHLKNLQKEHEVTHYCMIDDDWDKFCPTRFIQTDRDNGGFTDMKYKMALDMLQAKEWRVNGDN